MAVAKSVRSVRRLIAAMANRSPVSSGTLIRPRSRVSWMPTRESAGRASSRPWRIRSARRRVASSEVSAKSTAASSRGARARRNPTA